MYINNHIVIFECDKKTEFWIEVQNFIEISADSRANGTRNLLYIHRMTLIIHFIGE